MPRWTAKRSRCKFPWNSWGARGGRHPPSGTPVARAAARIAAPCHPPTVPPWRGLTVAQLTVLLPRYKVHGSEASSSVLSRGVIAEGIAGGSVIQCEWTIENCFVSYLAWCLNECRGSAVKATVPLSHGYFVGGLAAIHSAFGVKKQQSTGIEILRNSNHRDSGRPAMRIVAASRPSSPCSAV